MRIKAPNTDKYGPSWTPITLLCLPCLENNSFYISASGSYFQQLNKVHCQFKSREGNKIVHVVQNHPHSTPSRTNVRLQPHCVPTHERRECVEGRPNISYIYVGRAYRDKGNGEKTPCFQKGLSNSKKAIRPVCLFCTVIALILKISSLVG